MRLLILPGDGIGPEITAATRLVLDRADAVHGLGLAFEEDVVGFASLERHGTSLRPELIERARAVDGVILGPQDNMHYPPVEEGGLNVSRGFRMGLDLYANIRPARARPGLGRHGGAAGMDLIVLRENTEGFMADRNMVAGSGEFMPTEDVAIALRKITRQGSERIARQAFRLARARRRKVTAVHKLGVFKLSDGLFLRAVDDVAKDFPEVAVDDVIIDAATALLVREPQRFDVILATNLYGDILSDLASELSGSLGLAGSLNAGDDFAAAQAQHGSAVDIAGQDRANPTSLILSAAMLLSWLGERHGVAALGGAAAAIERAVDATLTDPESRTPDLGGRLGTRAFATAVAGRL